MSIDVAGTATAASPQRTRPRGRVVVGLVTLGVLVAVLASMLTYRQTVRSERQSTYDAVVQAQTQRAFDLMQAVAGGRVPADSATVTAQVALDLPYGFEPGRTLTVTVPRSRLGGETELMQLDIASTNDDLPWWTGQPYQFLSIVLEGTYISKNGTASIDESACVVRLGDPFSPVLTEQVELGNGYLAVPCTPEKLAEHGIS